MSYRRSHMCGELREEHAHSTVQLAGWVRRVRDHGQLVFVDLRDRTGLVQLVLAGGGEPGLLKLGVRLRSESVVAVVGKVARRSPGAENPELPTGDIEVLVSEMQVLSAAELPPFGVEEAGEVDEALRLRYRYLDLRRPVMQERLRVRHATTMAVRRYCDERGFWEIETPYLTRSTPEGARDYVVPSRVRRGSFFALPQSPQLFKQMLMVAGVDRYFQVVRCFRDEDLRSNRQPEFTQVDIEMSFADEDDVMAFTEGLVARVYQDVLDSTVATPFDRMSYAQAMDLYGSDKPDPALGPPLTDLGTVVARSQLRVFSSTLASGGQVKGLRAPGLAGYSRKDIDELETWARRHGAGGLIPFRVDGDSVWSTVKKHLGPEEALSIASALELGPDDLGLVVAGPAQVAAAALGAVRRLLGRRHGWAANAPDRFLWVTGFPLLERDEESGRLAARHHPFTAPSADDLGLLQEDSLAVRARAYDLVLNGEELAGGSVRCDSRELQLEVFDAMAMDRTEAEERFGFFLEALKYGVPPHAGIAMGLERLVMELTGTTSIRDVVAFPKTATAGCALTGAPAPLDAAQLEELGLQPLERER